TGYRAYNRLCSARAAVLPASGRRWNRPPAQWWLWGPSGRQCRGSSISVSAGVEGIDHMARPGARCKENNIKAARARRKVRMTGHIMAGRPQDALRVHGHHGLRLVAVPLARLDLHEDGFAPVAGDDVDLAQRRAHAPLEDAIALEAQIGGRQP